MNTVLRRLAGLFLLVLTGAMGEYAEIEETVQPAALRLIEEARGARRSLTSARAISKACDALGLVYDGDRFAVFKALEYCDAKGNPFGYGRKKGVPVPGVVLWDMQS